MEEIWKDIPGYEGVYQISNLGNAKSLGNDKSRKEKILKPDCTKKGYKRVCLRNRWSFVHRLVWEAFNGPIPDGMVINHKDQNPSNNVLENLMICTQSENLLWGDAQERRLNSHTGNRKPKWVIQLNQNNEILHFYRSAQRAEKETGTPHTSIWYCCNGMQKKAGPAEKEKYIWKYAE